MLLGDSTVMNHSSGPPVCAPSETTGLAEPQAGLAAGGAGRDKPEPTWPGEVTPGRPLADPARAPVAASWAQSPSLDLSSSNPRWPLLWPGALLEQTVTIIVMTDGLGDAVDL